MEVATDSPTDMTETRRIYGRNAESNKAMIHIILTV